MGMYGGDTSKRHRGYSNNPYLSELDLGVFHRSEQPKNTTTVSHYVNKDGKLAYVGTKDLKKTQSVPQGFSVYLLCKLN